MLYAGLTAGTSTLSCSYDPELQTLTTALSLSLTARAATARGSAHDEGRQGHRACNPHAADQVR